MSWRVPGTARRRDQVQAGLPSLLPGILRPHTARRYLTRPYEVGELRLRDDGNVRDAPAQSGAPRLPDAVTGLPPTPEHSSSGVEPDADAHVVHDSKAIAAGIDRIEWRALHLVAPLNP